jgi:hypothetical protein
MSTTVEITVSDDGKVTVGIADQPTSADQQPAPDIRAALQMAMHILQQGASNTGQSGGDSPDTSAPSGQSDAPGAPPGGVAGASDSSGAVATDPKAIWDQLQQQGQPTH